jgi:hypothetical protein
VKYIEDLKAKIAFSNSSHNIYYCPYCLDRERDNKVRDPKPDTCGKLYIHKVKKQGICFRCNTIVVSKEDKMDMFDLFLHTTALEETVNVADLPTIDIDDIPPAYEVTEAMEYLTKRNPVFTPSIVKNLDLRWVETVRSTADGVRRLKSTKRGILTPLRHKGDIKSYQIRYITNEKKHRFHTMQGIRLIASIGDIPRHTSISICEGFYDAVALLSMGFPNPVALLGSKPSKFQLSQLKEMIPYHINLCLDDHVLNSNLLKLLKKSIKTIETSKIWTFDGKDPEEHFKRNKGFRYKELELIPKIM